MLVTCDFTAVLHFTQTPDFKVLTTMVDVEMQDPLELEMLVTRRPKRSTAGNR